MVATVIALIALIILPTFRSRLDTAKVSAAHSEIDTLAKGVLMAEADANIQPRLQDLDNPSTVDTTDSNPSLQAPVAQWNAALETPEVPTSRQRVASLWKGPYVAFKRYTVMTTDNTFDNRILPLFVSEDFLDGTGGPILATNFNGFGGALSDSYLDGSITPAQADRYPTDPWGNPYFFFGRGRADLSRGATIPNPPAAGQNFSYRSSVIYSMGPDGRPGDNGLLAAINLYREAGLLGTGDDVEFRF